MESTRSLTRNGFGAVVARETHGDEVASERVEAPAEEGEDGDLFPEG